MLVKKGISPNKKVILQDIAVEVDSVWVVPVGHIYRRVTLPKIWFQDWKIPSEMEVALLHKEHLGSSRNI